MSIVQALIDQVDSEKQNSDHTGRVLAVELVIGRLCGVHVDSIRFAYEVLSPGTVIEGAALRIRRAPAVLRCHACGGHVPIDELTLQCPGCNSDDTAIEGGQELLLQSIELED